MTPQRAAISKSRFLSSWLLLRRVFCKWCVPSTNRGQSPYCLYRSQQLSRFRRNLADFGRQADADLLPHRGRSLENHKNQPTSQMSQPLKHIGEPTKSLRACAFPTTKDSMDHRNVEPSRQIDSIEPVDRLPMA
jgi:hypothetical protein